MRAKELVAIITMWLLVGVIACFGISHYAGPIEWRDKLAIWGVALTFWTSIVSGFIAAFNSRVQMDWLPQVERVKAILGLQYPAYKEAMTAVVSYHDALSRLQNGRGDTNECEAAESLMKRAWGTIYFLPRDFQNVWLAFWQQARFMKEQSAAWAQNPDAQKKLWAAPAGGQELGNLLERLGENMQRLVF